MLQQAIKLRYNNTWVLEDELLRMFGAGQYAVEFSMGQFVLNIPRKLSMTEIEHIQNLMGHYEERTVRHGRRRHKK
ncbi:hypothetical protein QBC43DRAFT_325520 [Cladorrhinum sp. PSN259]|nr:hypothetical protein QBC43DRAFT_325520 [Cladorrhinum sp. PSN259]